MTAKRLSRVEAPAVISFDVDQCLVAAFALFARQSQCALARPLGLEEDIEGHDLQESQDQGA